MAPHPPAHRQSRSGTLAVMVLLMIGTAAAVEASGRKPSATRPPSPLAARLETSLPGPWPLFPPTNWWNTEVANAPLDPGSAGFVNFINQGGVKHLHPDLGGTLGDGVSIYGMPYIVVDGNQPKKAVNFFYYDQSDGVNHPGNNPYPFYPIPDEAITQAHWIEGGDPGNVDLRSSQDRHMLIVDRDNRYLYELYNVFYDETLQQWQGGSGAFFDLNLNGRRPDGWTSADAAGLAILPGLLRYEEVYGPGEIRHALRFTVRSTNGYVYPASHEAGSTNGALPMGARLRLKTGKDISGFPPEVQKIFRAMKTYGLIVADNGTDMYIGGTWDDRWDNDVLNPAFDAADGLRLRGRAAGLVAAARGRARRGPPDRPLVQRKRRLRAGRVGRRRAQLAGLGDAAAGGAVRSGFGLRRARRRDLHAGRFLLLVRVAGRRLSGELRGRDRQLFRGLRVQSGQSPRGALGRQLPRDGQRRGGQDLDAPRRA